MNQSNQNWLQSSAFTTATQPLDLQMGTGHLNAQRALQQFQGGQTDGYEFTGFPIIRQPVPNIGWDYDSTDVTDLRLEYVIEDDLPAGSYVSITLAWGRVVELATDNGVMGAFDANDTFVEGGDFNQGFSDLNVYLLPLGATDTSAAIASSTSTDQTVEHLFFQIPTTGKYEF